jgi:glycosyltransferase involved in cell wall biosynthesis
VKFSVLLPTRNGGAFLPDALASVLTQDGDFEVVVADNANDDQTAAVLSSYGGDSRLRVIHSETVVPVTENWMKALRAARGEYLLMIGDDDLLLPWFFEKIEAALRRHGNPQCLTFAAYSYVAPGSFGGDAPALWSPRHFDMRRLHPERELPPDERRAIVRDMFRFKVRFPLNMQLTLFSRAAIDAVPGDVFRAPFPDHFALNSFLLRADRVVVTDERLVIVGVSPKSFGHFFYGGHQKLGLDYLGSRSTFEGQLEGSELVNSMHAWLLELRRTYPEVANVPVDRWGYAARQVNHWLRQVEFGQMRLNVLADRIGTLPLSERLTVLAPMVIYRLARRLRDLMRRRKRTYIGDSWPTVRPTAAATITSFARMLSRE